MLHGHVIFFKSLQVLPTPKNNVYHMINEDIEFYFLVGFYCIVWIYGLYMYMYVLCYIFVDRTFACRMARAFRKDCGTFNELSFDSYIFYFYYFFFIPMVVRTRKHSEFDKASNL